MIFPRVKAVLRKKGFRLYDRPFELNIVGVRSHNVMPERFDDEIHVFYKAAPFKWEYHVFRATTDPGTYWLLNPMQPQGTAILAQGQYVNAYTIGLHHGQYPALVQNAPVNILRDYNRSARIDFLNGTRIKGLFGINIHRANAQGDTKFIDKYSAGCQVFANAEDFSFFMQLCERHAQLYGNQFSYTLLDFRAMRREAIKRILTGAFALAAGLFGYFKAD
jgi:hypothetical protein